MKEKLCDGTRDNDAAVLFENEECIAYQVKNEEGELVITEYLVFPGIWLIYKEVHAHRYRFPPAYPPNLLEITHCREGRFEYDAGERFFYVSKGDMSVHQTAQEAEVYCPTQYYHGISVIIDPEAAPRCLSCILAEIEVSPAALLTKFCGGERHFIMRSTPRLEHIFSELYSIPEEARKGYFKVKILELLLFLNGLEPSLSQAEQRSCSKAQMELARQVSAFLAAHLNARLTIERLAAEFYVSPTWLKKSIYSVYGKPVYAYIKTYKMGSAALCLKTTDQTVSDIAHAFGYGNSSKFSKAFKEVMGMSPSEYRSSMRKSGKSVFLEQKSSRLE